MDNPGYNSLEEDESPPTPIRSRDKYRRSLNCSYEIACHGKRNSGSVASASEQRQSSVYTNDEDENWSRIDLHEDTASAENANSSSIFIEKDDTQRTNVMGSPKPSQLNSPDKSLPMPRKLSSVGDSPICRICHDGDAEEPLVSPCFCDGTVGMLHISCLETWLGTSKKTKCEICDFEFSVLKKPRSWKWLLRNKSLGKERSRMINDIVCFSLFTPFSMAVTVACLIGASYYATNNKSIQGTCLILVATANICIFILWSVFSCRRNYETCATWRETYQVLRISYDPPEKPRRPSFFSRSRNTSSTRSAEKNLLQNSTKKEKRFAVLFDADKGGNEQGIELNNTPKGRMSGAFCQTIEETVHSPKREPKWKDVSRTSSMAVSPLPGTPWPGRKKIAQTSTPMASGVRLETSTPANPEALVKNFRRTELCRATPYMPTPVSRPKDSNLVYDYQSELYVIEPFPPELCHEVIGYRKREVDVRRTAMQNILVNHIRCAGNVVDGKAKDNTPESCV